MNRRYLFVDTWKICVKLLFCCKIDQAQREVRERERKREDSWAITTMEHLSRVSLHPTFTGTMSLRSLLALLPPPFLSTSKWRPSKIVVMELHSSGVATSFAFLVIYLRRWYSLERVGHFSALLS